MGVVYLAEHPEMGPAALKFVHTGGEADATFRARFRREVEAAERVASPRVARVLAADPDAETPWLATAFVDGPTLRESVEDVGPMTGDRLIALAVALADALAAIHRADVVHRDLKPANILLTPETPVVIDFGIAAMREAPTLTRAGMALGTPGWMAPEQVRGRRCGPRADVFAWGVVTAYAASGRRPFGRGRAEAQLYRIVHEAPDLPDLPTPLDLLVPAAVAKDPNARPDVAELLATLTSGALEMATKAGFTALGPTVADRTAVVPTIMALGWGVDVLPARPGGHPRSVPDQLHGGSPAAFVPAPDVSAAPGSTASPAAPSPAEPEPAPASATLPAEPVMGPDGSGSASIVAPHPASAGNGSSGDGPPHGAAGEHPPAATFWFAGEEHRDARTLAASFQRSWDDAVDQVFRRRDPIWLGELRAFLGALGLSEADGIVAAGGGDAPPTAAMARLLLALDTNVDPRIGTMWLTPEGLVAAAQPVAAGRDDVTAARLADISAARVLRLWRALPGMERAASIDERWNAGLEAFGRFVAGVSTQAGWPSPAERNRAMATLLLCAVHPDHERQLERKVAAARRTAARRQAWWAQLAAEGQRNPAAAVAAVLTAERARALAHGERQAEHSAARQRRDAERQRRDAERADREQRRAVAPAGQARYAPLPRAQSGVRRGWILAVMMAGLLAYLWTDGTFGDALVAHYQSVDPASAATADKLRAYDDASGATGLALLLVVALPAIHVATRAVTQRGATRRMVRAYAGAAATLDLLLGLTLVSAAALAGLVLSAGAEGAVDPDVAAPLGTDEPWAATGLLVPLGLVGVVLIVRSLWRVARVIFARPVATPLMPAGYPMPGYPAGGVPVPPPPGPR